MKVHFVFAPTNFPLNYGDMGKGIDPPLGILYVAAYLRRYEPCIELTATDGSLLGYDRSLEDIRRVGADVVGLSLVTPNALGAYRLARDIRRVLPKCVIIFGGPHVTALPEEPFERSEADVTVIGEGEATFLELARHFLEQRSTAALADIKGICYRNADGRLERTAPREFIHDLDTIPFPARDLLDMSQYSGYPLAKVSPGTTILISRGCPFKCTYCSNNVWRSSQPLFRRRSPENVVAELRELVALGYREFFDNSDEFNTGLRQSKELLRAIIAADLGIKLKCQVRATPMDEELAGLMRDAGVWYLHLGIESGNMETLRGIRKKITLDDVERCCRILKAVDIKIWGLFMYFNIWEDNETLRYEDYNKSYNTFRYARSLQKRKLIDFFGGSITTPILGSSLWDTAVRHNLIKSDCVGNWDMWFYKKDLRLISTLPGLSESDIFKLQQKTVKYTIWSLIKSNVIDFRNLRFNIIRFIYFVKREILRRSGLK